MTTKATPSNSHITLMQRPFGAPRFHFDDNAPPPPPPPSPPPAAWHTGIDAEFIGHAQNKGWKLDDPKEAFVAATKQARELERHFGVPPDRLVKLPAPDAKPEDIRAYYERIGAPKEAKDYDLSAIKDPAVSDTLRAAMYDRGTPKDAAGVIAAAVAKAMDGMTSAQDTEKTAKLAAQKEALKANWGDKFAYNHLQAIEGARKLGINPEAVAALEAMIGYDQVMDAMRKIGANTREDTFVEKGGNGPTGDVTTREGAVARKAELMGDSAWSDRYLKGGAAEAREMTRINTLIDGAA
jgi:hypothetical protein